MPRVIGSGYTILEIQEPTDFTVRVEKVTPSEFVIDDSMCHQGLRFQKVFEWLEIVDRCELNGEGNFSCLYIFSG